MECCSHLFQDTLIRILDSGNPVLGSIALMGNSFIEGIKKRKDVLLIRVLGNNRDTLFEKYSAMLSE
jgi:nucleoside-triphosphatase THEP1